MADSLNDNPRAPKLIVARVMREFAVWWPNPVSNGEGGLAVLDLSQSSTWSSRIAISAQNVEFEAKASAWLVKAGFVEYTQTGSLAMHLTKAGLDTLNSLDAFRRYRQARARAEREEVIESLDQELSEYLGPKFANWLVA